MDRIQVCGTCDAGSIPAESTNTKNNVIDVVFCICALGEKRLRAFRQESNGGAMFF